MSKAIKTEFTDEKDFDYYRKRYALLFDVRFKGLTSKIQQENYISESKCYHLVNPIINNGRVFSADDLATTITDVDFNIIENAYNWDEMQVKNVYRFYRGYLPKDIIISIINPARDTLSDTVILPLTCENGYPLRRDTRPKNPVL